MKTVLAQIRQSQFLKIPKILQPVFPADNGSATGTAAGNASALVRQTIMRNSDDSLSNAETGLLLAAFATLLCSIMLTMLLP